MKLFKLKFGFLTMVCASMFLVSCGGGYDTEFSTLTYNSSEKKFYKDKDETLLFSGTAGEKNSSDELVILAEIKNGYLVTKKKWTDFGGELILTQDMEYKDGKFYNGWYNYIEDKGEDITITQSYNLYKNGKEQESEGWRLMKSGTYNSQSYLMIGTEGMLQATCTGNGAYYYPNGGGGDVDEIRAFLDCVKSQNLKNFHIFIIE